MNNEQLIIKLMSLAEQSKDPVRFEDCLALIKSFEMEDCYIVDGKPIFKDDYFKKAHDYNKQLRTSIAKAIKETGSYKLVNLYNDTLLFDAPYDFDCYCRYIEHRRERKNQA